MARSEHHASPPAVGFPAARAVDLTDLMALSDNDNVFAGGHDFAERIISVFLEQTPRLYDTAEESVHEGDGASLARTCDKLESQAAFFGARRLMDVCRKLQDLGHAQQLRRAHAHLDELEDELDRVLVALQRYLHR